MQFYFTYFPRYLKISFPLSQYMYIYIDTSINYRGETEDPALNLEILFRLEAKIVGKRFYKEKLQDGELGQKTLCAFIY